MNYYLQENISLFSVSEDSRYVTFLVTDPQRNVYSSHEGPFLYISQFRLATHLVLMEMETFNILAQSLHHKDLNLILLANTGRSGSTLLAQIFESVEGLK